MSIVLAHQYAEEVARLKAELRVKDAWIQRAKALLFDCAFSLDSDGLKEEARQLVALGGGFDARTETQASPLRWRERDVTDYDFALTLAEDTPEPGFWTATLTFAPGVELQRCAKSPAMAAGFAIRAFGEHLVEAEQRVRRASQPG